MFKTLIDLCLLLALAMAGFTWFVLASTNNPLCIVAFLAAALLAWLRQCWTNYEDDTH